MKKNNISVIIIAGNAEKDIERALESAKWAKEIVVILANSTDGTGSIAKKYTRKIFETQDEYASHYDKWRNLGLEKAAGDWIFYLDADEVITPELKKEILLITKRQSPNTEHQFVAYAVPRENYCLGQRVKYGGSWPDYVKRLFYKSALEKWVGQLHEEPVFKGKLGHLKNPIRHYTHKNLASMLAKTISWSKLEAEELHKVGHPPMVWWRFLRMMLTEFWQRGIKKQGFRDGTVGIIKVIFQMFSRFITYARLWELQQKEK